MYELAMPKDLYVFFKNFLREACRVWYCDSCFTGGGRDVVLTLWGVVFNGFFKGPIRIATLFKGTTDVCFLFRDLRLDNNWRNSNCIRNMLEIDELTLHKQAHLGGLKHPVTALC